MRLSDFDFDLPESLIAQHPRPRGGSRMLVVDRATGTWSESRVADLAEWLSPGDLVVANDSRVFPARLLGRRTGGGRAECLLLQPASGDDWWALVNPGQRLPIGATIDFTDPERAQGLTLRGAIQSRDSEGRRCVRLASTGASVAEAIDRLGHIPLPPYIRRPDSAEDRERYQTMFARETGSIAAPTAGLHFDAALTTALAAKGIGQATVTLHVGYGTFKPVKVNDIADHRVDAERFVVSETAASQMASTRAAGGRVVAVGTTTTRALESAARATGQVRAGTGATDLCILPGHTFRAVDRLLTNFHLPKSSLLLLVSAFAGRELVLDAYRDAISRGFSFYSYGDAMLIR
ncbi:MAG: tRNA preQ1(34) S-adenosylmethionine ribosyltransferase-isomerase QueA [Acidimicrobiia bacterium]|nr:tRNA preQ1(34) S-adenosylmethionine ribosyltransferase-isomerase QueA [Acidimicrobiia bacterium]